MSHFKVSCSSIFILIIGTLSGMRFELVEHSALDTHQLEEIESQKLLHNFTKHVHEQNSTDNEQLSTERKSLIFKRLPFNDSMENIQMMKNGTLVKSTYVPVVPNQYMNIHLNEDLSSSFIQNTSNQIESENQIQRPAEDNFVVKNGKKYRIVKVKKAVQPSQDNLLPNEVRRSFKLLPYFSTFLPLKWLTRENRIKTQPEKRSENGTQSSKLTSVYNSEENSKETFKSDLRNSEKIKKLINLFSIVKFENGECYANGIIGTCLHQLECEGKGGKFAATCAEQLGVCCYSEKTCGNTSNENYTYFINEGFPETSTAAPKVCTLTIEKASSQIKQLRLDFQIFQLREPTNGNCLHDRLVISGQDINDVVPDICGANTGQHIYVDVEDSSGPFNLNVITVGEYFPRNFRIKVTQMSNDSPLLAPKNCLQYYTEPTGYVQTFNYQQDNYENADIAVNGYFNNLNYAICIKKLRGFCSISYENEETDSRQPTFQLVNVDEEGERLLPPSQAGAETFDCPDDYIAINGIRLCGEKLNDATVEIDYTRNYRVTDLSNGPFVLAVRTDGAVNGRGFNLKYMQNPCLL